MQIKQWEDKNLSHFSYAVLSDDERKVAVIDPSRNPEQYMDFARAHDASIVAIIETHPHADFVSGHKELRQLTGATIYTHSVAGVSYEHAPFDEGETIGLGKVKLVSLHTPGHSPDSISILLEYDGKQNAVFTGDTLFIGDCGRPDLRETAGNVQAKRADLARLMYHSLREKLMTLQDDVLVYPAHGAGTLCGKNLSKENSSTIGREKATNWSLQEATEEMFVQNLLTDQPFIPAYFPFDVELNRKGAGPLQDSISKVIIAEQPVNNLPPDIDPSLWVVDVRNAADFKEGHLPHSINLMEKGKFETWLGSIIQPGERYYLAGESKTQLESVIARAAAIGYETGIAAAFVINGGPVKEAAIDMEMFRERPGAFTVVDVRNASEVKEKKIFPGSLPIPLPELRERINEIPKDKPVVIHCAAGYRSAAGSSMVHAALGGTVNVFDLGEAIRNFN